VNLRLVDRLPDLEKLAVGHSVYHELISPGLRCVAGERLVEGVLVESETVQDSGDLCYSAVSPVIRIHRLLASAVTEEQSGVSRAASASNRTGCASM
jgi:hypothetical protein